MKALCSALIMLGLTLVGCTHQSPLSESAQQRTSSPEFRQSFQAAGWLSIKTDKHSYRWEPDDLTTSGLIYATLKNESDSTLYAMMGDGFNSSIDQQNLYVAQGTGGYIQRQHADGWWEVMPRGWIIEGTRFIALRPGESYRLSAPVHEWSGTETGVFRFEVEYFDRIEPEPGALPFVDYSNAFTISQ
jgi:hypothetical protein